MRVRAAAVALVLSLGPWAATAQPVPLPEGARPSERRPDIPDFLPPEETTPVLPPIPPPRPTLTPPTEGPRVQVERFRFEGNTAFSDGELAAVLVHFTGRALGPGDLAAARDAISDHYVSRGYVTSGAVLPDQTVGEGVVVLRVVEGALARVEVEGNEHLRDRYLSSRVMLGAQAPLHLPSLERSLRLLQQDPRLVALHADLRPAARRGQAVLTLRVEESKMARATLEANNSFSPTLGEAKGRVGASHSSALGWGDQISAFADASEGAVSVQAAYLVPITARDTVVFAEGRYSSGRFVDPVGQALDIRSRYWSIDAGIWHPLVRTPELDVRVGTQVSVRENEVRFLGGLPFPLPGSDTGVTRVTALRLLGDAIWRDASQVIALRSTLSLGLSTVPGTRAPLAPDGRFVSWLGQLQWIRRFDPSGVELLARTDVQLASDPLLSMEQFSVGGLRSVRGYRENLIVRDEGLFGSLELRVPVWRDAVTGRALAQVAPFFDVGHAGNRGRRTVGLTTVYSVGAGLRLQPWSRVRAELYWGFGLAGIDRPGDSLQDHGVHFRVVASTW